MPIKIHSFPVKELNATIGFALPNGDNAPPYFSATDIAKFHRLYPAINTRHIIKGWMRNSDNILFLTAWEQRHNPNFHGLSIQEIECKTGKKLDDYFKGGEFAPFKISEILDEFYGTHNYMAPKKWIEMTGAIGIICHSGRYGGGTYMYESIAMNFASSISPNLGVTIFDSYSEYRHKEEQNYQFDEEFIRERTRDGYNALTKEVAACNPNATVFDYTDNGDLINCAVFGTTAKGWRELHPELFIKTPKNNMREFADSDQLRAVELAQTLSKEAMKMPLKQRLSYIKDELKKQLNYTARLPKVPEPCTDGRRNNGQRVFTGYHEAASNAGIIISMPPEIRNNILGFVKDNTPEPVVANEPPKKLMYTLI